MNANPLLLSALQPLGLPVCWLEYKGSATEYIVFNDALNVPALYGDDEDQQHRAVIQVHHYTLDDPHRILKEIRKALRNAGFTILDSLTVKETVSYGGNTVKNDTNTGYIHTVIRVEIYGYTDDYKED